ncbi:MAG: efflux RND transporter permease subunit [Limnochordia bacterium]
MQLPRMAVNKPVTVTMIILFVLLFGGLSLQRLGIDLLPRLNIPYITVATIYPLADPATVEEQVTKQVEAAVGTVDGLRDVESYSMENVSVVIGRFHWDTDLAKVLEQVRGNLDQLALTLPEGAEKPLIMTFDPNQLPLITMGVFSEETKDLAELTTLAKEHVLPRLEQIPGIAQISLLGGRDRQVQILYDPAKLREYDLTPTLLEQFLRYQNMTIPSGVIEDQGQRFNIKTGMRFQGVEELQNLIVGTQEPESDPFGLGALVPQFVRLGDIANIEETVSTDGGLNRINGRPTLVLRLYKQAGENTVAVAAEVKEVIEKLRGENIPLEYFILTDQSRFINQSIGNLSYSGLIGALLAILVLFFFLRNYQSITIISLAIPLSVIVTFVLMYLADLSLNLMTLGGLALGIGMLVDNSIVVLENIFRHRLEGRDMTEAAIVGSEEIAPAITGATLTTLVVFLPLIFVGGLAGELFKELGLTVSFSLLASLVVSITVVPLMASRLLAMPTEGARFFEPLQHAYQGLLAKAMDRKGLTLGICSVVIIICLSLVPRMGIEFLPPADQSSLNIQLRLPPGTPIEITNARVGEVEQILAEKPEVTHVNAQVGNPMTRDFFAILQGAGSNTAQLLVNLVPPGQRDVTIVEFARNLQKETAHIDARIEINEDLTMAAFTGFTGSGISLKIKGPDLDVLEGLGQELAGRLREMEHFTQVRTSLDERQPELFLETNPSRAILSQLTSGQIGLAINNILNGVHVGDLQRGGRSIPIYLQPQGGADLDLDGLLRMRITDPTGLSTNYAQLGRLVKVQQGTAPASIRRADRVRVVEVTAQLQTDDLRTASRAVDEILATMEFPPNYTILRGGMEELVAESQGELLLVLVLAIILVYLVLASQFESLWHPFLIMLSVPLAAIGALGGLWITGTKLGITALIGLVVLAGVVVNNAIVLVDYIKLLRERGYPVAEAVMEAGRVRLRPILMTTLTTILALVPMALGWGEGSEIQVPMAITVMGGLLSSTFLTLFIIPIVYSGLAERRSARLQKGAVAKEG